MTADDRQVRLRAFIGRSFDDGDEGLWTEIRGVLESLRPIGFEFEDAKEPQPKPVSEKVRDAIERNDVYIGILSRRLATCEKTALWTRLKSTKVWSTSAWVVQESGYALGRGKPVLLLIELGTDFPTANLDADREWISFRRGLVSGIANRLVTMLGHLLATRLPTPTARGQLVAATTDIPEQSPSGDQERIAAREPSFSDVMTLVDARKFMEANEAFEQFWQTEPESPFKDWVRWFFVQRKAIVGDSASADTLRETVVTNPENVDARMALVEYYLSFKNYDKAADVLREGRSVTPERRRPLLIRSLATTLSLAGDFAASLDVISGLCIQVTSDQERGWAFVCLADIAKRQGNDELQAAALETALRAEPGKTDLRFRLAYLYSQIGIERLALFHYRLRLAQGRDPTTLNNVGISLAVLKLPAFGVAAFEAGAEDSLLAKANLSHAYIDGGFLTTAEELASTVVASSSTDDQGFGRRRAAAALQRIGAVRTEEKDTEERILKAALSESSFRADYAGAFISVPVMVSGIFQTPYGALEFSADPSSPSVMKGEGTFLEPSGLSLGQSLLGSARQAGAATIKKRTVVFEAILSGRAGRFRATTTEEQVDAIVSFPNVSHAQGLVLVSGDGVTLRILEEKGESVALYEASKVLAS